MKDKLKYGKYTNMYIRLLIKIVEIIQDKSIAGWAAKSD